MKLVPFSPAMAALFEKYKAAGGCLAYAVVDVSEIPAGGEVDYQAVNMAAVPEVARQTWGDIDDIATRNPEMAARMSDWKPELMKSQVISLEQFLGPYYDMASKRLIVPGQTDDHLNHEFYYDDEETAANVIPWDRIERKPSTLYEGHIQGYANAFWGGPYRMRGLSMKETGELFNGINHELFNDFAEDAEGGLEIRLWSNDWWPWYFAAGLEWDGAYWWTVHDKAKGRVVITTTSVTD